MPNPVPPPALSLMDMREYRAYAANWALENPGAGSVSVAEWLVFRTWKADNDAVYAAACARTNATNFEDVLDPRLRSVPAPAPSTVDGPAPAPAPAPVHAPPPAGNPRRRRREAMVGENPDGEADDESSDTEEEPSGRRRRSNRGRKKAKIDRPLTKKDVDLTEKQAVVYDELRVCFRRIYAHLIN